MLKQLSSFSLIILATTSVIIAGENDPCNKYGWIGAKWICNGIWSNSSTVKQNLPDVKVPSLESKPEEIPAPVVKEEPKTPSISLPEEILPTIQIPQEKVLVRSSVTFIADKNSDKKEVETTNNDAEQRITLNFETRSYDALKNAEKEGILPTLKLLSFKLMQYQVDAKTQETGRILEEELHREKSPITRIVKQVKFKTLVIKTAAIKVFESFLK